MRLMEAVMDRYFPASVDSGDAVTQNRGDLRKFTGSYLRARVNSSSYEKIGSLLSVVKVQSTGEDTILISSGAAPSQWIRIEPLVFQRRGGQDKIVFRENSDGRITHLFLERSPHTACIRLSWHQSPGFHAFLLGVCVFLFLTTLAWPVNALRRKLCRCPAPDRPAPRLPRTLAVSVSVLCLLFLIGMSIFFINPTPLMFGVPLAMKLLLGFPLAAGLLGLGVLFYAAGAWFRRWWTWCDRLHYTSILLALILFLWFLNSWNLLGFRF